MIDPIQASFDGFRLLHLLISLLVLLIKGLVRLIKWVAGADLARGNAGSGAEGSATGIPSAWEGRYQNIPLKFFGGGCDREFTEYLKGESRVAVESLNDMAEWLLGCTYVSDRREHGVRDHWLHPLEFERIRRGDCEDFALWAWRKLTERGCRNEFIVGRWRRDGREGVHAWVLIYLDGRPWIFETTGRSRERMFKPLDQVAREYIPFAAIDQDVRKKVYMGITQRIMKLMKGPSREHPMRRWRVRDRSRP